MKLQQPVAAGDETSISNVKVQWCNHYAKQKNGQGLKNVYYCHCCCEKGPTNLVKVASSSVHTLCMHYLLAWMPDIQVPIASCRLQPSQIQVQKFCLQLENLSWSLQAEMLWVTANLKGKWNASDDSIDASGQCLISLHSCPSHGHGLSFWHRGNLCIRKQKWTRLTRVSFVTKK